MQRCCLSWTLVVCLLAPTLLLADDGTRTGRITEEMLAAYRAAMQQDPRMPAVLNAVTGNEVKKLALNHSAHVDHDNQYTNKIETGDITNQKASGRCWLFAGFNILRPQVIKKHNLKNFELSQNYSFFWDKLEKANLFLEGILETVDRSLDDRVVTFLLKNPFPDGGQWHMVVDLIEKYGVVPSSVMPDTRHAAGTGELNRLMSRKLRKDAAELRRRHGEGQGMDALRDRKVGMLGEVYRLLSYHFGEPPASFEWRVTDKDGKVGDLKRFTPRKFYEEFVGVDLADYLFLYDCPAHPYGKLYRIQFDRDLHDRPDMTFANVEIDVIKEATLKQVLAGEGVWFGCDVGKEYHGESGILRTGIYDHESLLGVDFSLTKKERILYRESIPTHAMAILGVDLVEGKPVKWRVENSWGPDRGDKGYLAMYDGWFEEYLYSVIIHRKHLPEAVLKIFEQEPETLPPWDPMFDRLR